MDRIEQIRAAHLAARPKPAVNPAWANAEHDIGVLLAEIGRLRGALQGAVGALEFSRDYHADLGNEEQAFAQDKLDAALAALEPKP